MISAKKLTPTVFYSRKGVCFMSKKIILAVLCLFLSVVCFSGIAYSFEEALNECYEQLLQKYPNVEAIKKQFGAEAKWQERTEPSIHDKTLKLQINNMEYPGINIRTLGYTIEGEDRFIITLVDVKKAGFVKFGGIDVGSAREDVIKEFGKPQKIEGNKLIFHTDSEYFYITFTVDNNKVVEMKFDSYPD